MGTARFYEFLAVGNSDLNVFILQPGIIRTALYIKGKLKLDETLDTRKLESPGKHIDDPADSAQFNSPLISQCGWQARRLKRSPGASCLLIGMWSS